MKKTKTEERFSKFVEGIKSAKSDIDIALVGFDLVEAYMGFRSRKLASQSLIILDHIFKK
jgi:hypothetical protein